MASPDPIVEERLMYLRMLGWAVDDPNYSLGDLKNLTAGGSNVHRAVEAGRLAPGAPYLRIEDAKLLYQAKVEISVADYGAKGNGVTDDTQAFINALSAANALQVTDSGTNKRPGAKLIIPPGRYMLNTLVTPLNILCDVESLSAVVVAPSAYASSVFIVGSTVSGGYLVNANVVLPDIIKPGAPAIVSGSEGVRTSNLGNSRVRFGKIVYFECGIRCTGDAQGTVYNEFFIGWIIACKISISLKPHVASGWCNSNTFIGGGISQSVSYSGGIRLPGWLHVEMDGSAGNFVNGNTFVGTSFEGDVSQYWLKAVTAANNLFIGCRFELGTLGNAVTVVGDTLTATAHGLAVGDMVAFNATVVPTGMAVAHPYFVSTVTDVNTFKVAKSKGGAAVVFSTAGTSVLLYRPPSATFSGIITGNNVIRDPFTPMGFMEMIQTVAAGNVMTTGQRVHAEKFDTGDTPVYTARNSFSTGTPSRPGFAAYPPTVSPVEDPYGWSTALGDRGVLFASARAEIGRITNTGGILQYQRPSDSVAFEIASVRRASAPVAITALSLLAATTTVTTVTLTGASISDYAILDINADLPAGISVAWIRVSAANTVKIGFLNITAAPIDLTVNVQVMIIRRYF